MEKGYLCDTTIDTEGYINTVKKMQEMASGREIILWGGQMDSVTQAVYEAFGRCNIDIKYIVSDESEDAFFEGKEVVRSIELFLEEPDKVFVVAIVLKGHGFIYQKLVDMGYGYYKDFYIGGIAGYVGEFDGVDSMLGVNKYFDDILGFKIYGNYTGEDNEYRILTLGGSTTVHGCGNHKCWSEFLYEKVRSLKNSVVVINGGMSGYGVKQEFLKFVRDGLSFKPHMLITFNGFNDVNCSYMADGLPYMSKYGKKVFDHIETNGEFAVDTLQLRNASKFLHGIEQDKQDCDNWIEGIKNIYAIAKVHGIEYYGFLQPMLGTGKSIIGHHLQKIINDINLEQMSHNESLKRMQTFYESVSSFVNSSCYMHDLSSIFDGKRDMYYDICHATEAGNEVIAEAVFKLIRNRL